MHNGTTLRKKRVGQAPQKPSVDDPFRKRSFDPEEKVALQIQEWEKRNPGTKFGWMVNRAIEKHLASCLLKKGAA